ncbi:hypothetical protein V2J09_005831 [Rumex salicifolius]
MSLLPSCLQVCLTKQVDVKISFKIKDLKGAKLFDPIWSDPQLLCKKMGASSDDDQGFVVFTKSNDREEEIRCFYEG